MDLVSVYLKSSIKPPQGLFKFGHSRGGLIREGGFFKKLDQKDIYDSFIGLLPHILRSQDAILRVTHKFDRFLSQTISKFTCKGFLRKVERKSLVTSEI